MVGLLLAKLRRDVVQQRAQFLAVSLTVFLGVLLFTASWSAYQDLKRSYEATFERLRFPDLWVSGGDVEAFAASARSDEAVAAVEMRYQGEVPLRVGGRHVLRGQVLTLPGEREPAAGRVLVERGETLAGDATAVLAERHFADHFDLAPGDSAEVLRDGAWTGISIRGVVVSAEYLWPARTRQDILTPPDDFGVIFVPEEAARAFGLEPQALVLLGPSADGKALDRLEAAAFAAGATDVYDREGQPSNAALQEDVAGFGELAWMFPALFLTAAGFGTYMLLNRMVQAQRSLIGMFLANGMPARHVLVHYLGYGFGPALLAGGTGAIAGALLGGYMTHMYTRSLSIPVTVTSFRPAAPLLGVGIALAAGIVATALPAWSASTVEPSVAMRGASPAGPGGRVLAERLLPPLRFLPLHARFVLRNITRARLRSTSVAVGVVLALTLIIVSWGMIDSLRFLVSRHFDAINREDARVYFAHEVGEADLAALQGAGAIHAERMADVQVSLRSATGLYATELLGFEQDTAVHGFRLESGQWIDLPAEGLLVGRALRGLLDIREGDTIELILPSATRPVMGVVAGFVDEPLGTPVYASLGELTRLAREAGLEPGSLRTVAAVQFTAGVDRSEMRSTISALPGVVAYADAQALRQTVDSLLSFFYVILGLMLAFGAALAFALVFNSMSITIAERTGEIATLLASGMEYRTVMLLLAAENLLVTAAATGPGLVIAWLAGRGFLASFDSDLFRFTWHPAPATLALSAVAIVLAALASQGPGLRTIRRLDLGAAIRERGA